MTGNRCLLKGLTAELLRAFRLGSSHDGERRPAYRFTVYLGGAPLQAASTPAFLLTAFSPLRFSGLKAQSLIRAGVARLKACSPGTPNLELLYPASACSRSAIKSPASSTPTESRIVAGETPSNRHCFALSPMCDDSTG